LDGKAPTVHTHTISQVTGLQTALDGKAALVHTHVIGDVTGLQTALDGKAALVHTHVIGDVTGLQTALDGKANIADALPFEDYEDSTFETSVVNNIGDTARYVLVETAPQNKNLFLASSATTDGTRPAYRAITTADLPANTIPKQALTAGQKELPAGFSFSRFEIGSYETLGTANVGGAFGGMCSQEVTFDVRELGQGTGGTPPFEKAQFVRFLLCDASATSGNRDYVSFSNVFIGNFSRFVSATLGTQNTNAIVPKSVKKTDRGFVIGGRNSGGTPTTDVFEIGYATKTARASMPAARDNAGGCILGNFIYIFASVPNTALLRYNITTNTWETLGTNTPNTGATYNCVSAAPISETECYILFSVSQKGTITFSESTYVAIYRFNSVTNTFTRLSQEGGGNARGTEFSFTNCNAAEYVGGVLMCGLRKLPATDTIGVTTVTNYGEYLLWAWNEFSGINTYIPAWYDATAIGANEQGSALFWHDGFLYESFGTRNGGIPIVAIVRRKFDVILKN